MGNPRSYRLIIGLALLLWSSLSWSGETIHVAVAANFKPLFVSLAHRFEQESGHTVLISSASSGKLFAQLRHGAPFQLFLSADMARPQQLQQAGLAVEESLFTYAIGRLILWSPDPTRFADGAEPLTNGQFNKIALGNPRSVPYGKAAQETLHNLGLTQTYADRLVFAEDVGQVLAFVLSGNADAGFLSLSQILDPQGKARPGSFWAVPPALHQAIEQGAVRLKQPKMAEPTLELVRFLRAPATQALLEQRGYHAPSPTPSEPP